MHSLESTALNTNEKAVTVTIYKISSPNLSEKDSGYPKSMGKIEVLNIS